jgi:CubicO group peptidase (beta-lactamase class C family)
MKHKLLVIIFVIGFFQSCHVGRFFIYNFADANDYKKFPSAPLSKAKQVFNFAEPTVVDTATLRLPKKFKHKRKEYTFAEGLKSSGTIAFLVIRNDSILYQWYRPGSDTSTIVPSFSMAKSYVSALIGIALDDGLIKSTSEPITNYLDDLDKKKFGKITIQHVLDMRSGIRYNENYFNPFGDVAKYYYGTNLKKYIRKLKIKQAPDKEFDYISLNTQLLGLILEKATGKSLTTYLQEKIWSQIGTEFDASWSIDSKKHHTEKSFCCINARAKDFAKFGRLYLRKGNWEGKQIISENWVEESVNFKTERNDFLYSNQWWHRVNYYDAKDSVKIKKPYVLFSYKYKGKTYSYLAQPTGDYMAEGFLGQFIYVSPSHNMICVRLGKKGGWIDWSSLFREIALKN